MKLIDRIKKFEPDKTKSPFLHTLYDGVFTFLYSPNTVTRGGVHVRDGMDLKRTMITVVLALQLCYLFGSWNIGHQHFVALGVHTGFLEALHLKFAFGLSKIIPIFIWTHLVGLGIEFFFAAKKGHGIEEGFLVTGALIPLIMPPDIPIWMLCLAVAFAVLIGKEAFGGTGMNIWNIALLARVFVFFAYPTTISGDQVWVAGLEQVAAGAGTDYSWWHTGFFNGLFEWFGWSTFDPTLKVVDGYSGATPLALAYEGGWENVTAHFSQSEMLWGAIPGSIGETSKPLIIAGALMLIATGIASWRVMAGMVIGLIGGSFLLQAWGASPFMEVPWWAHMYMGSFFFAMAFMATDPVTAASTKRGKWIYGILIGVIGLIIRVMNPAYPEGWMLAILLLNTFAPLIDHYVIQKNITKRLKRA
jgi:Na+-transporting NADH:ubiquinone oxidoreductase subunit B